MHLFVSVVSVAIILISSMASATPPNAIHAKYDLNRGELIATVQHPVSRVKDHFIREVAVYRNGTEVGRQDFKAQVSHRNQTMSPFKFTANSGDVILITTACNKNGSYQKTLIVK